MTRCARGFVALAALVALACSDIAAPVRDDLYEWRLIVPTGGVPDTVHFHWAREDLPVGIWVEDAGNLRAHMARAIDTWEAVYLHGEFQARLVDDSAGADVLVRATPAPPVGFAARAVRLHSALAPECRGATDLDVSDDLAELRLPIRVYLDPVVAGDLPGLEECLALTSIHELGHALGILAHSPNQTDIMFPDPVVDLPSELDRETAEALYHLPPTIRAVRPN